MFFPEKHLRQIIFWLAALAIIGAPLIISTGTLFPFLTGKQTFFQALVSLMGLAYAGLLWKNPAKYKPPLNLLTGAVYLFLGAMALSTVFSVDAYQSFWSTIERMDGLVHYLYWGLFFLILTSVFRSQEEWLGLLKAMVISGLAVSAYALGQLLHLPGLFPATGDRIYGSLGNPTFLAAVLVFQVFLSWLLWTWERAKFWRILAVINAVGALVFIGLSETRGAFVGLAVAAGFLFLVLSASLWQRGRKFLVGALWVLALVAGGGVIFLTVSGALTVGPLGDFLRLGFGELPNSLQSRLLSWSSYLEAWQARPVLGWGPATGRYIYGQFFPARTLSYTETWLEKAHNLPIEILATTGLLGFLSFLAIFGAVFWRLWRARKKIFVFSVSLGALFVAYFVQNLFLFDTPSSLVYLAVALGLAASRGGTDLPKEGRTFLSSCKFGGLGLALLLVIAFPVTTWHPWQAAKLGIEVVRAQQQGNLEQALQANQKAFQLNTYVNEKLLREGRAFVFAHLMSGRLSADHPLVQFLVKKQRQYIKQHPLAYRATKDLGMIYLGMAQTDSQFYPDAKKFLEKARQLAPSRPDVDLVLIELYRRQGNFNEALAAADRALALNPEYQTAIWAKFQLLREAGQIEKSFKLLKPLFIKSANWKGLMQIDNYQKRHWQELLQFSQNFGQFKDDCVSCRLSLAVIYQRLGEANQARQLVQKAVNLQPAWQKDELSLIQAILRLPPAPGELEVSR